jgi:hypothetical protein
MRIIMWSYMTMYGIGYCHTKAYEFMMKSTPNPSQGTFNSLR